MKIKSARFGEMEVAEEQIILFPQAIPGFPDEKRFAHFYFDQGSAFSFLQSIIEENLCFLLVNPFDFLQDYEFTLDDELAQEMELSAENPPLVFSIATVKEKLEDMTVNLQAPIVINGSTHQGRQIILDKVEYSIRHKLFPNGLPTEAVKGGE